MLNLPSDILAALSGLPAELARKSFGKTAHGRRLAGRARRDAGLVSTAIYGNEAKYGTSPCDSSNREIEGFRSRDFRLSTHRGNLRTNLPSETDVAYGLQASPAERGGASYGTQRILDLARRQGGRWGIRIRPISG